MSGRKFTRRTFIAGATAGAVAGATRAFHIPKAYAAPGRVVILGFDGVEPSIAREMMDQGDLPNLKKLAGEGTFKELGSTIPPQSPVAWTSFTTCKNPGGHNIFDFIRRDAQGARGPFPMVGTGTVEPPELNDAGEVTAPAQGISYRKGDAFWQVADAQGAKSKILNVPFAFPADKLENGVMLCGLGVTDLRGTTSTYTTFSDSFTPDELTERLAGGNRTALPFDGSDNCAVTISGPRDKRYSVRDPKGYTPMDIKFSVDRKSHAGSVDVNGRKVDLVQGEWSEWCETVFPMSPTFSVYGVARFYPIEIGQRVEIYMTCQQFHPEHPYVPFTEPNDYSNELHERYGLFKTIGWHYDTHAMRQNALDEDAFLKDIEYSMAWRERLTLDEIDRGNFDLLVSAWTATDRVGHMFWRFRDPRHPMYDEELAAVYGKALENCYKTMDRIVGNVMAKLNDDDLFMILSDHGFESWRKGFNVNDWLEKAGYFKASNRQAAHDIGFLQGIDWQSTKAYSVGLSSLYLNQKGREKFGAVSEDDASNLIAEIKDKLLEVRDVITGEKVFTNIYTRDDYKGEAIAEAPDISFGYARYFQSSKAAAKGGVGDGLFELTKDKWSGEHASADVAWCPGIFFCNKKVESDDPNILDLGVTALKYLGRDIPGDFEGEALV